MIETGLTVPNLRVFRQLDVDVLSPEFIEKVTFEEGNVEWVDADKARDLPFTEEIMETTIGAALVDSEGNIVAQWAGPNAFVKAETAKAGARVTFNVDIDQGDEPEDLGEDATLDAE